MLELLRIALFVVWMDRVFFMESWDFMSVVYV